VVVDLDGVQWWDDGLVASPRFVLRTDQVRSKGDKKLCFSFSCRY
jgi:hypothetical protein